MSGFPAAVPPPEQRFVRLRNADSPSGAATTTFLAAAGDVDAEKHPLVLDLAQRDPARAARVAEGLKQLLGREHEVLTWLEADASHTALFAREPAAALRQALPDLPAGLFDGWPEK